MAKVHVFVCGNRFESFKTMRAFTRPVYTDEGDVLPSEFAKEVELSDYEPMCLEAIHGTEPQPVRELVARASYADQWLSELPEALEACQAFCVFSPNHVANPQGTSLDYVGAFSYTP